MTTEQEIREGLDGKFIVVHFSGRLLEITVPADFNPYDEKGHAMVRKAKDQKVVET